ncbi:MAG: ribonuclease III [Wolbachia pipientis]|nr:ribonuclease III [Wolbachia pipientis]
MQDLNDAISKIINYRFKNDTILKEALTHPSLNKKNKKNNVDSYERLEFLGDSILNMVVSIMLFKLFPEEKEGGLAKRKMDLVCGSTIANVARMIKLDNFIIMDSRCEHRNSRKFSLKNLENAFEALIGAIYIDGGFSNVEKFVIQYWKKLAEYMLNPPQDSKTSLQEWAQKNKLSLPKYELVEQNGPAHSPEFIMSVCVGNYGKAFAYASSKKAAEQKAAKLMLEKINNSKKTSLS